MTDTLTDNNALLIAELERRHPLLGSTVGRFGNNSSEETIPWFFGLLMSAASIPTPGATCIVINKTEGTAAILAMSLALAKLRDDFPKLAEEYARTSFTRGQRVMVRPSRHVYEYDGVWDDHPGNFRLKVQGKRDRRNFPISDVVRLEPTNRKTPRGALASNISPSEPGLLDQLLGLTTHGNTSLFRNTVLVYMPQVRFAEIANTVSLSRLDSDSFVKISDCLAWGSIQTDGEIRPNDGYQVIGEPLIAVTSAALDLAAKCRSVPDASTLVIVDGAGAMARDLQSFDDIMERQRALILASPDEMDAVRLLQERGASAWHPSSAEIVVGEDGRPERTRVSLIGRTIRASETRQRSRVTVVECADARIQAVSESLDRIAELIVGTEQYPVVDDDFARLYGLLFEFSDSCFGVPQDSDARIQSIRDNLRQVLMWLGAPVVQRFREAITGLESVSSHGGGRSPKADALIDIVTRHDKMWAVATRSPHAAEMIRNELTSHGIDVPVMPVDSFAADDEYDGIVVVTWPNKRKFARLMALGTAEDIRVLAYPFESRWVQYYQHGERSRSKADQLDPEELSPILGIDAGLLTELIIDEKDAPDPEPRPDTPVFRIEDRVIRRRRIGPATAVAGPDTRSARFVRFVGDCYALLTDWSNWHVLNSLILDGRGGDAEPQSKSVSELRPGDFALFRATGDTEILRAIAEDQIGVETYRRTRRESERWKRGLNRIGRIPTAVRRRLSGYGLDRTIPTITGWLENPDRIGPGDLDDIDRIATAAQDSYLRDNSQSVKDAIRTIRVAHQNAGHRLTQLILGELQGRMGELTGRPVLLDLGYGQAWVVQLDFIASESKIYPGSQVNRLIWVDDSAF